MEITIREIEPPFFNEFALFEDINVRTLINEKKITVQASAHTKTRVHTSLKLGKAQRGVNWLIDGFKTHQETSYSFLAHTPQVQNFFVRSKKQNKNVYLEYVKKIVRQFVENCGAIESIDNLEVVFVDRYKNW